MRWSDEGAPLTTSHSSSGQRLYWTGHARALQAARRLRALLLMAPSPDALAIEQATLDFVGQMEQLAPACPTGQADARLRTVYGRVLDRIGSDFAQPLTIAELAQAEGRAPLQFLREFTRLVGVTPHAFIVETRVQAARAMMRHGAESLASIALDCGFSHQSHMGTAFRKLLGQTPRQYANAHTLSANHSSGA